MKVSIKLGFFCSFHEANAPNYLECRGEAQLGREIGRTRDELRALFGQSIELYIEYIKGFFFLIRVKTVL